MDKLEELWKKHYLDTPRPPKDGWKGVAKLMAEEYASHVLLDLQSKTIWTGSPDNPRQVTVVELGDVLMAAHNCPYTLSLKPKKNEKG